ncbi:H-type small acid-soluble spore protein [Oceanobacillus halophilus]|uniref:Small, acid-soluble spore protein H n=1 Tax=Oceanobacillus halophilus TaxID=930130 RepID=A0A495A5I4_9BACI|nr:H-type small acid-soluble spore protein [Oceanobacillus halophilus]RKQ33549.1 H-type small acid-soluble spore protein [Oceanobacillus halophilus]
MNKHRAQEIAQSADTIQVMYEDKPIYIQHVDENTDTARVFPLNEPEHEFEVNLSDLVEQK